MAEEMALSKIWDGKSRGALQSYEDTLGLPTKNCRNCGPET